MGQNLQPEYKWNRLLVTVPHATCLQTLIEQLRQFSVNQLEYSGLSDHEKEKIIHTCDYAALTIANRLTETLEEFGLNFNLTSVPGTVNRTVCDLNRHSCQASDELNKFWSQINRFLYASDVKRTALLDIHSFPPWDFNGHEVVILDPTSNNMPYSVELETYLKQRGIDAAIITGGSQNAITVHLLQSVNKPAICMLLEFNEKLLELNSERWENNYLVYSLTIRGEQIVHLVAQWLMLHYLA